MQLTDQTVAAAGLTDGSCTCRARLFERGSIICRWHDCPVPVCGLDGSAVKNEDEQQQTEAALKVGAVVLECSHQHAGHDRLYVRVKRLQNCTDTRA